MEKKMKAALLKKRQAQALIQNLEEFKSAYTESDRVDIPVCLEQLENHKADFIDAISKLEDLDDRAEAIDGYLQERCDMDSRYRRLKGFLLQHQPSEASPLNASMLYANASALSTGHSGSINLRLPKIELPTFDGDSTKWLTFRDRFVAMIDSSADIPSIMKLQYLLSSLKGDAALLFEHTTLTADNYAITWASLLKRYDNPRMLVREYYRKIHYLPGMKSENVDDLAQLTDEFTRHVNGLKKLNEPVDAWDTPLTNMLFLKLDASTILAWEKYSAHQARDKYKELVDFLQDRVRILRSTRTYSHEMELSTKMVAGNRRVEHRLKVVGNAATTRRAITNASGQHPSCGLGCREPHNLRNCPEFSKKDVHQRREIATREHLCYNCLNRNHHVKDCRSSYKCTTCNARHHSLLHLNPVVTMAAQSDDEMVLLETVLLQLVDDYGNKFEARALLDSGSMCNFISEDLAHRLVSPLSKVSIAVSGIGQTRQQVKGSITATAQAKGGAFSASLEFLVLKTPSAEIPTIPIDIGAWDLNNVQLADPTFHVPGKVDVVIGGDTFWELHTGRKQSLGNGKPWLIETPFGWAVSGNTSPVIAPNLRLCHTAANECTIEALLQRFWEAESIHEDSPMSLEEGLCEKHYANTTSRNVQGRYIVSLPRSPKADRILGLSKDIADRRLLGVERRLNANPAMEKEYKKFMSEYERLGHMIKLDEPVDESKPHYFIPHHAVVKELSTTTKTRVVFDASCKSTSGYSLNDTLLIGPTVQDDLLTIILRFRKYAIAIVADVEKMYRQILHCEHDRKLLCIRYRERSTEPIATYELQTVTYGTASAPYLATRTLQQIAHDHKTAYPKAVDPVLHDFYVDDLLTGAADVSEAIEIRKQTTSMLKSAGFVLKKWASNIPEALEGVPSEDLAIKSVLDWQEDQTVSTLGLVWQPSNDMFRYRVDLPPPAEELTRSLVLSYTAKMFDPLGLLGPTVILAKIFLQRLWELKQDGKPWDWHRTLPWEIQEEWRKFHSTLYSLRELRIPRFVAQSSIKNLQLHLFADASKRAYGACCYVRAESTQSISVRLLAAKSKVVSLSNTHSIARLELCAARLAVHLFQRVNRALKSTVDGIFCWTDSMTVMHWLKSSPRRWKPFVANRVAQIQEETRISSWHHVPGVDNPADDISRGLHPEELIHCERWWHGPSWLTCGQEEWPEEPTVLKEDEADIEERIETLKIVTTSTTCDFSNTIFARYSVYGRLRRILAYCLRFLAILRTRNISRGEHLKLNVNMSLLCSIPPLAASELQDAELKLCQLAQHYSFAEEIDDLKRGKQVNRRSKLKWLSPYLDSKGMLRVGGRLSNANIPEASKHPIVLASSHRLSVLLTEKIHQQELHAGPQHMLTTLRQKFWIIGGRSLVKRVYHQCHTCFRNKPTLVKQAVADLPEARVTPTRPFAVSGVDYCGPFMLKSPVRNRSPTKAYIAIFVCFATRAVHIELVSDLTSTAFLSALYRFVARRGKVAELHSDNATTFKGAAHELHRIYRMLKIDEADRRIIFDWCAENEMVWKFIPPRAPHFGGLWEAAVKSAKKHLIKTIGISSLTQENMLTLLAQIEQCLNSRPLIPLSDDPTDLEALTPGHFLIGSSMHAVPQTDLSKVSSNRLKEYQLVQKLIQGIWARWYPEYLQHLQARAKHVSDKPVTLEVNQLVIVKEDNVPPTVWPKGRITALHPGKDGVVRVVTIRTGIGKEIVRAVSRIALLPNPIEYAGLEDCAD